MARFFFAPVGELLGSDSDGVPVTGGEDGVGPMTEITALVSDVTFDDD